MQVGTMCATFSVNFQEYLLVACARCRQKDQTLNMAFATTTKRSAECRDNDDDDNGSGERGESLIKFLIIQMCTNESVFIHAYSLRQSTLLLLLLFLVSIVGVDVYNALSFIGIYTKHIIADTLPVPELETPRTIGAKWNFRSRNEIQKPLTELRESEKPISALKFSLFFRLSVCCVAYCVRYCFDWFGR